MVALRFFIPYFPTIAKMPCLRLGFPMPVWMAKTRIPCAAVLERRIARQPRAQIGRVENKRSSSPGAGVVFRVLEATMPISEGANHAVLRPSALPVQLLNGPCGPRRRGAYPVGKAACWPQYAWGKHTGGGIEGIQPHSLVQGAVPCRTVTYSLRGSAASEAAGEPPLLCRIGERSTWKTSTRITTARRSGT